MHLHLAHLRRHLVKVRCVPQAVSDASHLTMIRVHMYVVERSSVSTNHLGETTPPNAVESATQVTAINHLLKVCTLLE